MSGGNGAILVVDDSSVMRRILAQGLNKLGYTDIVEAVDGLDALVKLAESPNVKLILTDWNMPNLDGLSFLKKVKSDEKFKHIPILMVTTEAEKGKVVEAIAAGAANYLMKPFTPEGLKEKLDKILK